MELVHANILRNVIFVLFLFLVDESGVSSDVYDLMAILNEAEDHNDLYVALNVMVAISSQQYEKAFLIIKGGS